MLDLRLLLHGVKTSIPQNYDELQTNHKIEAVFFDPSIKSEWINDYTAACLKQGSKTSCAEPQNIPLELPTNSFSEGVISGTQPEVSLSHIVV